MRDIDNDKISCRFNYRPERRELFAGTSLFIWDEFPSNHRECFEAAYVAMEGLRGKVVLAMGDWKQILPVVSRGDKTEVLDACMFSSPLWQKFEKLSLTVNMRLRGVQIGSNVDAQVKYAAMIKALAHNENCVGMTDIVFENSDGDRKEFAFPSIPYFNADDDDGLDSTMAWLFPSGQYDAQVATDNTILATTNDEVDRWNGLISDMNPETERVMLSQTWFGEVDDLHGNMKFMLSDTALNNLNRNGVPPHELKLKVNDICILMQNINVKDGITNNTRVRILGGHGNCTNAPTNAQTHKKKEFVQKNTQHKLEFVQGSPPPPVQTPTHKTQTHKFEI
jgi:hypothetical protein